LWGEADLKGVHALILGVFAHLGSDPLNRRWGLEHRERDGKARERLVEPHTFEKLNVTGTRRDLDPLLSREVLQA